MVPQEFYQEAAHLALGASQKSFLLRCGTLACLHLHIPDLYQGRSGRMQQGRAKERSGEWKSICREQNLGKSHFKTVHHLLGFGLEDGVIQG